jgi:hypothetical protein
MTRTQIEAINQLFATYDGLKHKIECVKADKHGVTIQGTYYDIYKEVVKQPLLDVLNQGCKVIEAELAQYGVTVDY